MTSEPAYMPAIESLAAAAWPRTLLAVAGGLIVGGILVGPRIVRRPPVPTVDDFAAGPGDH